MPENDKEPVTETAAPQGKVTVLWDRVVLVTVLWIVAVIGLIAFWTFLLRVVFPW